MKRLTTVTAVGPEKIAYKNDLSRSRIALEEERSSVLERIHKLYNGSISKFFNALDQSKPIRVEKLFERKYRAKS